MKESAGEKSTLASPLLQLFYCFLQKYLNFLVLNHPTIPKHREDVRSLCIELYYQDGDIVRKDNKGRRVFLSNEFRQTGWYSTEDLIYRDIGKVRCNLQIVAEKVFDRENNNVASSKNLFAENILKSNKGFENIDFSGFIPLLNIFQMVISDFDSNQN